jgi:OmpA-OmpF porin, OOP family
MKPQRQFVHLSAVLCAVFALQAQAQVQTQSQPPGAGAIDVSTAMPDAKAVSEGLFPEEACEQLKAAGFKCMGFKPAVRYSLPASSFKVGSAELPDALKKQLDVFGEALKGKRGTGKVVRIEGHADASGLPAANLALSQRRAEAVKEYLVQLGADAAMLEPVGLGSNAPKNSKDPLAPENRRVEIGRAAPPS